MQQDLTPLRAARARADRASPSSAPGTKSRHRHSRDTRGRPARPASRRDDLADEAYVTAPDQDHRKHHDPDQIDHVQEAGVLRSRRRGAPRSNKPRQGSRCRDGACGKIKTSQKKVKNEERTGSRHDTARDLLRVLGQLDRHEGGASPIGEKASSARIAVHRRAPRRFRAPQPSRSSPVRSCSVRQGGNRAPPARTRTRRG